MLEIGFDSNGDIKLAGRFDASQAQTATHFLDAVHQPSVVDLQGLEYISSAGLGVLLATQKRLVDGGGSGLRLVRLNNHVADVFRIAGLQKVFEIEYDD